MADNVSRRATR